MPSVKTFRKLYTYCDRGDVWLDTLPNEINTAFFDNPYVESKQLMIDAMLPIVFPGEDAGWVEWFLYEWQPNNDLLVKVDGEKIEFSNVDDFCVFLRDQLGWDE